MGLLILYLTIAIIFSFLCSILEAVLLSVTPSYASVLSKVQPETSKTLQEFKDNIDKPLAAILTLNTFAHTLGAAGVGAQAQAIWGDEYLSLVSAVLTIIILILSEIIPKTLGANYWQSLTPFTVKTLKILIYSPLWPLIMLSQFITKRLKRDKSKSVLSRADFTAMAEIGIKEGVLHKDESRVIRNLLGLNKVQVHHIMTPRTVISAAPEQITIREFYDNSKNLPFSRIPIYETTIDNISGYVLKGEVLQKLVDNEGDAPLHTIKRPIFVTSENTLISQLINKLVEGNEHVALVVDEYGGTAGIITLEDIIETLLGLEITDEFDDIADMQDWAKEAWRKRAKRLGINEDEGL
jgi:CBS domain containing-hemolysin-like protein